MATLTHAAREANRAAITPPLQFTNEPMIDWTNPENLRRMHAAIDKVRAELGQEYDLVIGGRHVQTGDIAPSVNPAKPRLSNRCTQFSTVRGASPSTPAASRQLMP